MVGAWLTASVPEPASSVPEPASVNSVDASAGAAGRAVLSALTVVSASTGGVLPDGDPASVPDPGPGVGAGSHPESGKRLPGCPEGYVCAYTSLKGYRCDRYGKVTYGVGRRRAGSCCASETA